MTAPHLSHPSTGSGYRADEPRVIAEEAKGKLVHRESEFAEEARSARPQVEDGQDSDYPGTPPPNESRSSSGVSLDVKMTFKIRFLSGTVIACTADSMTSVGWAKAQAAEFLDVPAERITLLRGSTILYKDYNKLLDVLGQDDTLDAVAETNVTVV